MTWSAELKQQVLDALRSGESHEEVHRTLGVSRTTIGRWAKDAGIPVRWMRDRICLEDGCDKPAEAKGLCHRHRHVAWRTRFLTEEDFRKAEERLLARSFPTSCGCRIWTASLTNPPNDTFRYGSFFALGESVAHRVAYKVAHGEIPEGMQVDHLCSVTLCVEGDHLEAVSQQENIRRTWERGRGQNRSKFNSLNTLDYWGWVTAV